MEKKLKTLESSPNIVGNPEYTETNERLNKIYQEKKMVSELEVKVIGTNTEKSSNFFLTLEKSRAVQN